MTSNHKHTSHGRDVSSLICRAVLDGFALISHVAVLLSRTITRDWSIALRSVDTVGSGFAIRTCIVAKDNPLERDGVHSQDGVATVVVVAALRTRLRISRHDKRSNDTPLAESICESFPSLSRPCQDWLEGSWGNAVTNTTSFCFVFTTGLQTKAQYSVASSLFANILNIRQPPQPLSCWVSSPLSQRAEDNIRIAIFPRETLSTLSLRQILVLKA